MPTGPRPEPPTRCTKLVYNGTFVDTSWTNVMWLYLTGSGTITTGDLNDLASACATAFGDNLLPQMDTESVHTSTQVVLYGSGDDVLEGHAAGTGTGGVSGNPLPASASIVITWQIAPHYRGGHPRTYLGGMSDAGQLSPSSWGTTFTDNTASAAIGFHNDIEAITGVGTGITTVEHGIVSFVRNDTWRDPPVFYRIAGANCDTRIDTQRRRLGADRPS